MRMEIGKKMMARRFKRACTLRNNGTSREGSEYGDGMMSVCKRKAVNRVSWKEHPRGAGAALPMVRYGGKKKSVTKCGLQDEKIREARKRATQCGKRESKQAEQDKSVSKYRKRKDGQDGLGRQEQRRWWKEGRNGLGRMQVRQSDSG